MLAQLNNPEMVGARARNAMINLPKNSREYLKLRHKDREANVIIVITQPLHTQRDHVILRHDAPQFMVRL